MKVTWLTQAGLLFDTGKMKIMVDPYLSDSLAEEGLSRRIPVDTRFLLEAPDVLLITHEHKDHLDPDTLDKLLSTDKCVTVLAPEKAFNALLAYEKGNNLVLLPPHSVWSEGGVTFYSVKAEHSDRTAAGFIIDDGSETFYISGDTVYNYDLIDDVLDLAPDGVDFAFLPINGRGCNMNAHDAADLAYEIGAKTAVPLHYGLFDEITPSDFDFDDALILTPYEETKL